MSRTLIGGIVALALMFGAAACGGGDGDETIDVPGGGQINVSDDLPDEFPGDIAVYDGADFQGSFRGEQNDISGLVATWTTGDDFNDVVQFYDDELDNDGWNVTSNGDLGGQSSFWSIESEDGEQAGYVSVSRIDDDNTTILVAVGDNESSGDGSASGDDDSSGDDVSSDGDGSTDDGDSGDDGSSSDGGSAELPDEAELPDDFPSDLVPLPDGSRVTSSSSFTSGGTSTYSIQLYVEEDVDTLADNFESSMADAGWTSAFTSESGGVVVQSYATEDNATGGVSISIEDSDVEGYAIVTIVANIAGE